MFYVSKLTSFNEKSYGDGALAVEVGVVALETFSEASAHRRHPHDGQFAHES